jgi:hypothetical protein
MSLDLTNTSIAIYQGPLEESAIRAALIEAKATTALSLEVEVPSDSLGVLRGMLEGMGFRVSGSIQRHCICVRFSKKVRDADNDVASVMSYDPNLAIPAPVLQPSAEEILARQRTDVVLAQLTKDVDARARAIKEAATPTGSFTGLEVLRDNVSPRRQVEDVA